MAPQTCGEADPTVVGDRRGACMATATGDLLFSRAFAELAGGPVSTELRCRCCRAPVSGLAAGELMQREDAWNASVARRPVSGALPSEDGGAVPGGMRARRAQRGTGRSSALGRRSASRIGLAFQILDDILDVTGPPERTGKPRGADLLDGTVTLPLIEARALRRPDLAAVEPRTIEDRGAGRRRICDQHRRQRCALDIARLRRRWTLVAEAKAATCRSFRTRRSVSALELVADGVVERYA